MEIGKNFFDLEVYPSAMAGADLLADLEDCSRVIAAQWLVFIGLDKQSACRSTVMCRNSAQPKTNF